jgi:hypothetical protein
VCLSQLKTAVQLVKKYFPGDDHIFVHDNAFETGCWCTLASKMTKGPSENFFIEVNTTDANSKPIYSLDTEFSKKKC